MSGGLDDVVQGVGIEVAEEGYSALEKLASAAENTFERIFAATDKGKSGLEFFGESVAGIAAGMASATGAVMTFVEAMDRTVVASAAVAQSFGATMNELDAVKELFGSVGLSGTQIERSIARMSQVVSASWAEIKRSVADAATTQDQAAERVAGANLKVQESALSLANFSADNASKQQHNILAVSEAYRTLQFAARDAAATAAHDTNSVEGATLSLASAQERLNGLMGRDTMSADQKKQLELRQANLAVAQASQSVNDALLRQQKDQAEAADKQKKAALELADAKRKQSEDEAKALLTEKQLMLANLEAVTAVAEAKQRQHQAELGNVEKIAAQIKAQSEGYKTMVNAIDLTEVSARKLAQAVTLAFSPGGASGQAPKGIEVFRGLLSVFETLGDSADATAQKTKLVQQLLGGMGSRAGASTAEIVEALNRGGKAFDELVVKAQKAEKQIGEPQIKAAKDLTAAYASLEGAVLRVGQALSTAASPTITAMFKAIQNSIESTDGLLHNFISGLEVIGDTLKTLGGIVSAWQAAIDKAFDLAPGTTFKVMLIGILTIVAAFAGPFLAIPAMFALVIVAIGSLADQAEVLKAAFQSFVDWFAGTWLGKMLVPSGLIIIALYRLATEPVEFIKSSWDALATWFAGTWLGKMVATVSNLVTQVKDIMGSPVESIKSAWEGLATWFNGTWAGKLIAAAERAAAAIARILGKAASTGTLKGAGQSDSSAGEGEPEGLARGGKVVGPGGPTEDAAGIFALSSGEFVTRAAAVAHYGVDLFNSLNNMTFPGMAMGGPVGVPVRTGTPSGAAKASSILNLTIGGEHFDGLRAPEDVASRLKTYAVGQQSSSLGADPSWVR